MRKILFLTFFIFSGSVFADTYSAISTPDYYNSNGHFSSMAAFCSAAVPNSVCGSHSASGRAYEVCVSGTTCAVTNFYYNVQDGSSTITPFVTATYSCPAGGTLSSTNCINATACVLPQIRNPITAICQIPATCTLGQSINPNTNTCVNVTCPVNQIFLASPTNPNGACAPTPSACPPYGITSICATVESYCGNENGSIVVIPACPPPTCTVLQHLSPNGLSCVANIELSCPLGQHAASDNLSCVVDNVVQCPGGTFKQIVDGVPVCGSGTDPNPVTINNPAAVNDPTQPATIPNPAAITHSFETGTISNNPIGTPNVIKLDTSGLAQEGTQLAIKDALNAKNSSAGTAMYTGQGRFYTSTGKTVVSVGATALSAAANSPVLKIATDVFKVTFPAQSDCASCDMSIPAVLGMNAIQLLPFCASWMPAFWGFIKSALTVVTVFMSIRIIVTPTA